MNSAFIKKTGPQTSDLLLSSGAFGLGQIPARLHPDSVAKVVCGFCSTGCGLTAHLQNGIAVGLSPTADYPVNLGMACPKGWEALTPLAAPDRATDPLWRNARGILEKTSWDHALTTMCARFKEIQARHGNASVAFISTGQIVTEEMALLGALTKFGMGMVHGDGNTRQCMATAVAAYKESFGFDAPPFTYDDFEQSDVMILVGANLCIAHPIMWQRILRNPHSPRIFVIDPRKTETALAATDHLGILPKSDLTFFYGLANLLIQNGAVDEKFVADHTTGFEEFSNHVRDYSLERIAGETGLSIPQISSCVEAIAAGKRVSFWWTMGVNQSHEGTRVAQAIINLALMTGNIGRPGTGANSITGQCNAMGSRLFSNTTNLFGGRDFTDASHREQVAASLGIPEEIIPRQNSLAYDQILAGVRDGAIKGLWIIGTNTAHSWIDQEDLKRTLSNLDFLVVQDMYATTETAQCADLVLPAGGWGEKEGTFINSERRIGVSRKVARAPGKALADFAIFRLVAHYWGCEELLSEWTTPEAVFRILTRLSKDRPCDISGIHGYADLDEYGGVQWPFPKGAHLESNERRLFESGKFFHADGKARFCFAAPRPAPEPVDSSFPFLLLTGRGTSAQWHTQTRTGKSAVLRQLYPAEIYVEMNLDDARRLKIRTGEWVEVKSRRGSLRATAVSTAALQRGQIFIPMHYPETNRLTKADFDPQSRQPAYKACAVALRKL